MEVSSGLLFSNGLSLWRGPCAGLGCMSAARPACAGRWQFWIVVDKGGGFLLGGSRGSKGTSPPRTHARTRRRRRVRRVNGQPKFPLGDPHEQPAVAQRDLAVAVAVAITVTAVTAVTWTRPSP
jgi:hypothetical protein